MARSRRWPEAPAADDGTAGTGDGGPATAAVLGYPMKAIEGPAPKYPIYIADQLGNRIRRVDANGTIATAAGSGRWGCARETFVAYPADLALDGAGKPADRQQHHKATSIGANNTPSATRSCVHGFDPRSDAARSIPVQPDPGEKYSSPLYMTEPLGVAAATDGASTTPIDAVARMPPGGGVDAVHTDWVIASVPVVYINDEATFAVVTACPHRRPRRVSSSPNTWPWRPTARSMSPTGSMAARAISPAGISTLAGGGSLIPQATAWPGGPAEPFGVALDGTGTILYISDIALHQVWKPGPARRPGPGLRIPVGDGSRVYVFDAQGII